MTGTTTTDGNVILARGGVGKPSLASIDSTDEKGPFESVVGTYVNLSCMGSLLFGYGLAEMNSMEKQLAIEFDWSGQTLIDNFSFLSTAVFVGAAVGCLSGGLFAKLGRRNLNLILHFMFVASGLTCALSYDFTSFCIGRLVMGYAVGLVSVASPLLISEMSPTESRGAYGVRHQLGITVGILIAIAAGSPLTNETSTLDLSLYMRCMLGFPCVISGIAFLIFAFWKTSETPYFLAATGRKNEARKLLRHVYGRYDVETELRGLVVDDDSSTKGLGLWSALKDKYYRKTILIGLVLAIGQQASGINAFVSLSTSIYRNAGIPENYLSLANTLTSVVNCLMTFPAIYIIEVFGRRALYVGGILGMTVCLALVPIAAMTPLVLHLPTISVISVVGFIVFFAVSTGPALWVVLNEMFVSEITATAAGLCTAANWMTGICVVYGVSQFSGSQYLTPTFTIFAVSSAVMLVFVTSFVLETKGLTNAESPYLAGRNTEERRPLTIGGSADKYV